MLNALCHDQILMDGGQAATSAIACSILALEGFKEAVALGQPEAAFELVGIANTYANAVNFIMRVTYDDYSEAIVNEVLGLSQTLH